VDAEGKKEHAANGQALSKQCKNREEEHDFVHARLLRSANSV
jgi:hypothetical protein